MYVITLKETLHNGNKVFKFDNVNVNSAFAVGFIEVSNNINPEIKVGSDRTRISYFPKENILGIVWEDDKVNNEPKSY